MKRLYTLLFFVVSVFPNIALAECRDPSRVAIGFVILLSLFLLMIFVTALGSYVLMGGRKHIKKLAVCLALSLLLGMFGLVAGLIKEQNNNSDRIPFLSEQCD